MWDVLCHMMMSSLPYAQLSGLKHMSTTTLTLALPRLSTMPSDVTMLVAPVPNIALVAVSPSSCDLIIVLNFVS